jgi:hypothetical protein
LWFRVGECQLYFGVALPKTGERLIGNCGQVFQFRQEMIDVGSDAVAIEKHPNPQ